MVRGIELFRDHFKDLGDCYAIIGGTACDLAFSALGLEFRATKDLDIVLMADRMDDAFGQAMRAFVKAGGYQHTRQSDGVEVAQFYRFSHPKNAEFPSMLELFSRQPNLDPAPHAGHLTPIPIGEEEGLLSLSAILMDDNYYQLIANGRIMVAGISTIKPEILIALKARAWIELSARKEQGVSIDSREVKKHKNDVFRLFGLLTENLRVTVPTAVQKDLGLFLDKMQVTPPDLKSLGLGELRFESVTEAIIRAYGLDTVE